MDLGTPSWGKKAAQRIGSQPGRVAGLGSGEGLSRRGGMPFNLLQDPWIPLEGPRGHQEVGLLEAFDLAIQSSPLTFPCFIPTC